MDLTESAPTPSGLGRPIESDNVRTVGKYSLRTRATVFVIGSLLSWGVISFYRLVDLLEVKYASRSGCA